MGAFLAWTAAFVMLWSPDKVRAAIRLAGAGVLGGGLTVAIALNLGGAWFAAGGMLLGALLLLRRGD